MDSREAAERARLAETFLFRGAPPEAVELARTDPRTVRQENGKGGVIYAPHAFRRCLGVVLEGRVQVNKGALIMSVLEPGDLFGAAALFNDRADYATTLTARAPCRVLLLPQALVEELMGRFLHANPGLESRFNKYFYFEDYNGAQLLAIFQSMCAKNGYTLDDKATEYAESYFKTLYEERDENFGNARDVRNVFERAVARQSDRVAALEKPGKEELMALTVADLQEEGGPVPDGAPDETLPESP